jgi:hypothetical protein
MITNEDKKYNLIVENYNNIDDMFDDVVAKLELIANLSLQAMGNNLSYSIAMYSSEIQDFIRAVQLKHKLETK